MTIVKGMKVYPLYLGDMWSESNSTAYGDTAASVADPEPKHRMVHTPSTAYVIDHPQVGKILFDSGMPDDPQVDWPQFIHDGVKWEKPAGTKMTEQLALIGLKPEDIDYVVTSHMHFDHVGNDALFAETAEFYVGKEEAEFAYKNVMCSTDPVARGYYLRDSVLCPRKKITYLEEEGELFPGIEVVICPGHTPGVIALLVRLENQTLLLTEDAVNNYQNYEGMIPGGVYDSLGYKASIKKLHQIAEANNALVLFGHDTDQFKSMKLAPAYYA